MNSISRTGQRGVNVVILLCAMVLLITLAIGAKFYGKKLEARREAERTEQALRADLARQAQEARREQAMRISTSEELNRNHAGMLAIAHKWDDAIRLSASTPRYALPQVILQLQATRREMDALKVHDCLNSAKQTVVEGMDGALRGFEAFMRMNDDNPQARLELESQFSMARSKFQFIGFRMNECSTGLYPPKTHR